MTKVLEKDMKFDEYELEIVRAIQKDEIEFEPISEYDRKRFARYAQNTITKKKAINIRISEWDLIRLKTKAAKEGLPYQTMISSILHKVADKVV